MRRILLSLRLIGLILRLLYAYLRIKVVVGPYFPYIRFSWHNRREMRALWGELRAIRQLI